MPYADSKGVRIHYEVEGQGSPLVLQHGFGSALESWYELGYVDRLRDKYQSILVDARGHGRSDKPHQTAAYASELQAADIVSVLRELGIRRADYWGYSMGGRIGFAIAQYAPEWVQSLIISGAAADGRSRIGVTGFVPRSRGVVPRVSWLYSPMLHRSTRPDCLRAILRCST